MFLATESESSLVVKCSALEHLSSLRVDMELVTSLQSSKTARKRTPKFNPSLSHTLEALRNYRKFPVKSHSRFLLIRQTCSRNSSKSSTSSWTIWRFWVMGYQWLPWRKCLSKQMRHIEKKAAKRVLRKGLHWCKMRVLRIQSSLKSCKKLKILRLNT